MESNLSCEGQHENCERCEGIRRYPQATQCEWCGQVHSGDANNCATKQPSEDSPRAPPPENTETDNLCMEVNNQLKRITEYVKENTMLQRGTGENRASASNRSKQASGLPYIKSEHLSTERRVMSILMARAEKDRWNNPSVLMKVRYDGKMFLWQVNDRNPNYDSLIEILGADETKWAGNDIQVHLEQDEVTDRYYPRVESTDKNERKTRK